jgi:hypothetical protein
VLDRSVEDVVVGVIRERGGETLPGVFRSEAQALSWVRHRVARGTILRRSLGVERAARTL